MKKHYRLFSLSICLVMISVFSQADSPQEAQKGGKLILSEKIKAFKAASSNKSNTNKVFYNFNLDDCPAALDGIYGQLFHLDSKMIDQLDIKKNGPQMVQDIWDLRRQTRERFRFIVDREILSMKNKGTEKESVRPTSDEVVRCANKLRYALLAGRYLEDYVGEAYLRSQEPKLDQTGNFEGPSPFLVTRKTPIIISDKDKKTTLYTGTFNGPEDLQSGDVIISRGSAFTSAAIARVAQLDSQFSHVSLVYRKPGKNGEKGELYTIEAHAPTGMRMEPWKAKGGHANPEDNVRGMLLRYKNPEVAKKAAEFLYKFVSEYEKNPLSLRDHYPNETASNRAFTRYPYDFKMTMNSFQYEEMACPEVVSFPFALLTTPEAQNQSLMDQFAQRKNLSKMKSILKDQGEQFPLFPAKLDRTGGFDDFLGGLGITLDESFAPGDMDVDTNFYMLAEWRNYDIMKNSRTEDVMLTKFNYRLKKDDYRINRVSYSAELIEGLAEDLRPVHKFFQYFPKGYITTIYTLWEIVNSTKKEFERRILKNETDHGTPMTMKEMFMTMNHIISEDKAAFLCHQYCMTNNHVSDKEELCDGPSTRHRLHHYLKPTPEGTAALLKEYKPALKLCQNPSDQSKIATLRNEMKELAKVLAGKMPEDQSWITKKK